MNDTNGLSFEVITTRKLFRDDSVVMIVIIVQQQQKQKRFSRALILLSVLLISYCFAQDNANVNREATGSCKITSAIVANTHNSNNFNNDDSTILTNNGLTSDGKFTFYTDSTQNVSLTSVNPGDLVPLSWPDGRKVKDNIYRVGLPPSVRAELIKYAERIGLYDFLKNIFPHNPIEIGTDHYFHLRNDELWHNKRPVGEWCSDMHWISPGDKVAHDGYLRALGDGGMDEILGAIGSKLGLDGISCYHLTFIAVSNCHKGYVHHDFNNTGVKAFNLIIPMELVPGSEPELDVVDFNSNVGRLKYQHDVGLLIGDNALHATATASYGNNIRLMATVFLADVNEANVNYMEYSQPYPPNNPSDRLRDAGEHWKPDGSSRLPRTSDLNETGSQEELSKAQEEEDQISITSRKSVEAYIYSNFEKLRQTDELLMLQIESLRSQNKILMNSLEELVGLLKTNSNY